MNDYFSESSLVEYPKSNKTLAVWDWIFLVGVFLIPYDNSRFSPSSGWAAISPYLFFISCVLCFCGQGFPLTFRIKYLLIFFLIVSCSLVCYGYHGFYESLLIKDVFKILLGLSFFVALYSFFKKHYGNFGFFFQVLLVGYFLSFLVGLGQFLMIKFFGSHEGLSDIVFRRVYAEKVQFTFTEPSFTSIHLFGVLIPLLFLFGCTDPERYRKYIKVGFVFVVLFSMVSIISGSSARMIVDGLVFLIIFLIFVLKFRLKVGQVVALSLGVLAVLFLLPESFYDRLQNIFFGSGSNIPDPSAAIRAFRVEAALFGWIMDFRSVMFGVGFGNLGTAMDLGMNEASKSLVFEYSEIEKLRTMQDGLAYSLPVKLMVELGVVWFVFLCFVFFRKKFIFSFVMAFWVSVQFDSLAFYGFWIYLVSILVWSGHDSDLRSLFFGSNKNVV